MPSHTPVLVSEILALFQPKAGDSLLDLTLGQGGHTRAYLDATAPNGTVFGIDADPSAVQTATEALAPERRRFKAKVGNFAYLKDSIMGGGILELAKPTQSREASLREAKWDETPQYTHILFDLGIGSHQLAAVNRGFSFGSASTLTMRYGREDHLPPAQVEAVSRLERSLGRLPDVTDILQYLSAEELADILYTYGEERFRRRIAQALKAEPIPKTSAELAERVRRAVPGFYRHGRIHAATRTFQALRLAVNRELEAISRALPQAWEILAPGGVLAAIAFHSLEDRIVKHAFRRYRDSEQAVVLTKKPIRPGPAEIAANPRARSAKLRAIKRKGG